MARNKFSASRAVERRYSLTLRKVARTISAMIGAHIDGPTLHNQAQLQKQLDLYSEAIGPWANRVAAGFIASVNRTNQQAWSARSQAIATRLKTEMATSRIGQVAQQLQSEQVTLIQSIPIEAGIRAQRLAMSAATGGRRADDVAAELLKTEQVTTSRATLIARTEIAKANSAITQARAEFVGATHYIWRTAGDGDVRESHAELDGQVFRYDDPPSVGDEGNHGPGEYPNCRCYSEPIIGE